MVFYVADMVCGRYRCNWVRHGDQIESARRKFAANCKTKLYKLIQTPTPSLQLIWICVCVIFSSNCCSTTVQPLQLSAYYYVMVNYLYLHSLQIFVILCTQCIAHSDCSRRPTNCIEMWCSRLVVPSVKLSTVGSRAFPAAASSIWNSLPEYIVDASTLQSFKHHLKTFLAVPTFPDILL